MTYLLFALLMSLLGDDATGGSQIVVAFDMVTERTLMNYGAIVLF